MRDSVENVVRCGICPRFCVIEPGAEGECRVRGNVGGELRLLTYGRPCSVSVDPIEKKPLFHVHPGAPILSIGGAGCNLSCRHCQNWQISQARPDDVRSRALAPEQLPALARREGCDMVAYTYTEPMVSYEYTLDCCAVAREAGLQNVLVTAAYVNPGPLGELCQVVDAANVDIKAFSERFYRDVCGASLAPVLKAVAQMRNAGLHLEITNLVIPTLNDSDDDLRGLCRWVVEHLGAETPLHFSRFFPQFELKTLPATPAGTLLRARELAKSEGLKHVYVGNLRTVDGEHTFCPACGCVVVEREGYTVSVNRLRDGRCPECGAAVCGMW